MTKVLTVKDVLNIEDFNPMDIDVSEFEELAKSMPKDANIDLHNAEVLAAQCLRAADRCSEILSTLIWYEGKVKANRNAIRNRKYLAAKDKGYKTVEERKAYAEGNDSFIEADNVLATAYAARKYFEMRLDYFLKTHQYMKERLRSEQRHQMSSGFSETVDINNSHYGEKEW